MYIDTTTTTTISMVAVDESVSISFGACQGQNWLAYQLLTIGSRFNAMASAKILFI